MSHVPRTGDLDRRAEIHDLVVAFYREIAFDAVLGPVFTEVAETDWSRHMPKLTDYWCRVLLREPGYDGWFLEGHQRVHDLEAFEPELFDRWYDLWVSTVDQRWRGPKAEEAKEHAARMMRTLARRLTDADWVEPSKRPTRPAPNGPNGAVSCAHASSQGCNVQIVDGSVTPA